MKSIRRLFFIVFFLPLSFLFFLQNNISKENYSYETYLNWKYNYKIQYPKSIFIPQGESVSQDGQKFISTNQKASLLVYGSNNTDNETLQKNYQNTLSEFVQKDPKTSISYKTLKNDFYIISGTQNQKVFYTKVYLRKDQFKTFWIEYPVSEKETFDPIVSEISPLFRSVE